MIVFALKKIEINIYMRGFFLMGILLNFYFTSFTKIYLAESLFISFINILLSLLLMKNLDRHISYYFFIGLLIGLVFTIKKIGPVFAICFILFVVFSKLKVSKYKEILLFVSSMLLVVLIENFFFYSTFKERESVLTQSMIGKIFIISGKDSFDVNKYSEELRETLNLSKNKYSKIHRFIENINNPFLKAELLADFEVVAQYQFLDADIESKKKKKEFIENVEKAFFELLKFNFKDYVETSIFHYIGMWSAGHKFSLIKSYEAEKKDLLYKNELVKSSGPINIINYNVLKLAQNIFKLLFLLFLFLTLLALIFLFVKKNKYRIFFIFFIFTSQIYLVTISFVNVATLRYLMPIYPMILICSIFVIKEINNLLFKDSKNFKINQIK